MTDWIFVLWFAGIPGSSFITQKTTEAQCKGLVAMYEQTVDPWMAYCTGPKGQTVRTSNIKDRIARMAPSLPGRTKPAGGI